MSGHGHDPTSTATTTLRAHNYQVPEVQAIADTVGDSFELAVRARDVDANLVVFCGVRFMAEGCYTLAPHLHA